MLGHVGDVIFELDGQLIAQYIVKSSIIGTHEYHIGRSQIVRFEEKKMVVDDMVKEVTADKKSPKEVSLGAEPAVMRHRQGS